MSETRTGKLNAQLSWATGSYSRCEHGGVAHVPLSFHKPRVNLKPHGHKLIQRTIAKTLTSQGGRYWFWGGDVIRTISDRRSVWHCRSIDVYVQKRIALLNETVEQKHKICGTGIYRAWLHSSLDCQFAIKGTLFETRRIGSWGSDRKTRSVGALWLFRRVQPGKQRQLWPSWGSCGAELTIQDY